MNYSPNAANGTDNAPRRSALAAGIEARGRRGAVVDCSRFMGIGQKPCGPAFVQAHRWLPGAEPNHLDIVPSEFGTDSGSKCLADSLFCGKPRSQVGRRVAVGQTVLYFSVAEDTPDEAIAEAFVRSPDTGYFRQVDSESENHLGLSVVSVVQP